jgi:formamidopyrimidine-DNA glycosylase
VIVRNGKSRVFRSVNPKELVRLLSGERFFDSEALGKQLVFRFGQRGQFWLGLHLGMTGELRVEPPKYPFLKYDHLILRQSKRSLVFSDQRQFGRVLFAQSNVAPSWWAKLPPSILSDQFKRDSIAKFCHRRKGSALKSLLLMQERFPGIGNWMADEIFYRATRNVCENAVEIMDENWEYPETWLFAHRWESGGKCPRCRTSLVRELVGGRRTCWCPKCQPKR